jgi:holo-[acyl-carrier protein] synthase
MIFGIGTDIVEIKRIKNSIDNYGERFLNRIYTATERQYCESFNENKELHYAARFAAKEAFSKAIGTGITQGFKFLEIGVSNQQNGKPEIELSGDLSSKWGKLRIYVSLSHTETDAIAIVILED